MSQYTILVDQFLLNTLQPEIDRLTISLLNMEKYSYNNASVIATKEKLSKLLPIYDFLYEYAHGNEEIDMKDLKDMMNIAGMASIDLTAQSSAYMQARPEQTVTSSLTVDYVRIYVNGEIVEGDVWWASEPVTVDIFTPSYINKVIVDLDVGGVQQSEGASSNHIRFDAVELTQGDELTAHVQGFIMITSAIPDLEETKMIRIVSEGCTASDAEACYVGSTPEAFSVPAELNVRTDISVAPVLSLDDVKQELDEVELPGDIGTTFTVFCDLEAGDIHVMAAYDTTKLRLVRAYEQIFNTEANFVENVHLAYTSLVNTPYTVAYLRSLSDIEYTLSGGARTFGFVFEIIGN